MASKQSKEIDFSTTALPMSVMTFIKCFTKNTSLDMRTLRRVFQAENIAAPVIDTNLGKQSQ